MTGYPELDCGRVLVRVLIIELFIFIQTTDIMRTSSLVCKSEIEKKIKGVEITCG